MENNTPRKKQLPAFLILGIIALVAAVVLALTNALTRGPIAEHQMAALKDSFGAVMPAESYEILPLPADAEVSSLYVAKNGDEVLGYCVTAVGKGYNGDVAVTLGVDTNGLVTGCAVGDTSFAETAGFGARAKEPAFQEQFVGIDAVNGGSFEALSGATVTSKAVLDATNKALRCVDSVALNKEPAADPLVTFGAPAEKPVAPAAPLTGNVQSATAKGFASDVKVELTVDGSGAISALTVDASGETPGLGQRCAEEEFTGQFIGKTGPFTLGDGVDGISGATITSDAVVAAVNAALEAPASAGGASGSATVQGFQSEVTVTVTLEDGAVASILVDASGETPGLGQRCAEEEFTSQFIGKAAPLTLGDGIDSVSGATITSTAVVDAANAAIGNAASAPAEAPATVIAEDDGASLGLKDNGTAVLEGKSGFTGTVTATLNVENGKVTDGTVASRKPSNASWTEDGKATSFAKGMESKVTATLSLNEDGTIAELKLNTLYETEYFGDKVGDDANFVNQFIGKAAPFTLGEDGIDAVSNATITSKACIEAINDAAAFAAEGGESAPAKEEEVPAETKPSNASWTEDGKATSFAKGMESKVTATLSLNEDGTIAELKLNTLYETEYFGDKVGDDANFVNQFIGKAAPFTLGEDGIDAVSNATITSKACIEAINDAAAFAAKNAPAAVKEPAATEAAELTAAVEGFDSDVKVTVTLDAEGKIATLTVDASGETPGLGQKCMEEAFTSQFIGKAAPFTLGEGIDGVSGATITSKAAVEAINKAVENVQKAEEPAELTAAVEGFDSDVKVTVALDAEGKIATLTVDASGETPGFGQKCMEEAFTSQFIGKAAPFTLGEGIDGVSGATITSKAAVEAINKACGKK